MKALRTTTIVISGVLIALAVLYAGGTYLLLRSAYFKELINPPDSEVRINFDAAYSPLPGLVIAKGLDVRGQHDAGIMWAVTLSQARVRIDLLALFRNEVRITTASGTKGKVRFSSGKKLSTSQIVDGISAELPDLVIQPEVTDTPATKDGVPDTSDDWAVHVSGIDIEGIDDIWVDEYRFRGLSFLRGGLEVSQAGMLTVLPSKTELKAGSLAFGAGPAADIETIAFSVALPQFDPATITPDELMTILNASVEGDAEIENVRFLNYYLQKTPWIFFDSGKGSLKANLRLERGELTEESFAYVEAKDLSATLWGQTARGSGKAAINFEEGGSEQLVAVSVNFGTYRVEKDGREAIVGQGLIIKVATPDRHLVAAADDWRLDVTLPPAKVADLGYFNSFLPRGAGVKIVRGVGSVEAVLKASAKNRDEDAGTAKIDTKGVELQYAESRFQGDASVIFKLKVADVNSAAFDASGTTVELKNVVSTTKSDKQRDWWGRIALSNALLTLQDPVRFKGQLHIDGKDLRPLIGIFGAAERMPKWMASAIAFDGLKATGFVDADEFNFNIDRAEVRSENVNMDGWFSKNQQRQTGALLVKYGVLTLGLKMLGDDVQFKLVNADAWYKQQKP